MFRLSITIDFKYRHPLKIYKMNFDSHEVSVRTFVVVTNIVIDLPKLFESLPVSDWIVVPKKRGVKIVTDPNKDIPIGSIITLKYKDMVRGVLLKTKKVVPEKKCDCLDITQCICKVKSTKKKFFRNSVTVVMKLDKNINFKVTGNGKFQITGCKTEAHAQNCVMELWKFLKENTSIWRLKDTEDSKITAIIMPAMRNIDFSIGFTVDRRKLHDYINNFVDNHFSILQEAFGNAGVNIKTPVTQEEVHSLSFRCMEWDSTTQEWSNSNAPFSRYYSMLSDKDRKKEDRKSRFNTFLVFYSGKVIMSGLVAETMRQPYYNFVKMLKTERESIEEQLVN